MNDNALIAMSGGVDSSVAAYLTKAAGYRCMGVTMKLFSNDDIHISNEKQCCSLDDIEDARRVCNILDIPYHVFNFSDKFKECVIDKFIAAYESGATPNPCIDCNRYIKFEKLFLRARELYCDRIVTGHYARVEFDDDSGRYLLKKGLDPAKDQSYVLYNLTKEQLCRVMFPLGGLTKEQVRSIAEEQGFATAHKRESQDICFVPDGKYSDFIRKTTGREYPEGNFIDMNGNVLGRHKGIINYTVGQRKGLGLALPAPMYVRTVDPAANTVTLCSDAQLYSTELTVRDINLISVDALPEPTRLKVKVRYRQPEQWATVCQTDDDTLKIVFESGQRAVTAGQAAVLYDGNTVVGGGTID